MRDMIKHFGIILALLTLGACATSGQNGRISTNSQSMAGERSVLSLAKRLQSSGNHGSAIALFRQAYNLTPLDPTPLLGLSESLQALGQYHEAVEVLGHARDKSPKDGRIFQSLGGVYLALGEVDLAESNYLNALNLGNERADVFSGLAISQEILGKHQEAQKTFDRALLKHPDDKSLLSNFGLAISLSGDTQAGVTLLESLVVEEGATMQFRQNLALSYFLNGDYDRAQAMASIDLDPQILSQTLNGFANIKALKPSSRMETLIYGTLNPQHDLEAPANPELGLDDDIGRIASERVVKKPEPEPEPKPEPAPEPELPDLPPLMEPEGWAVQIAAYRFAQEVIDGWEELKNRYFDIIGHLDPRRSEVNFGSRDEEGPSGFYYRLNAGPLSGFAEAKEICDLLISEGGECWIRPPEPVEGKLPQKKED